MAEFCAAPICYREHHIQVVATAANSADFKSLAIFKAIEDQLNKDGAKYVKKIKGIFRFEVKKGGDTGIWLVDVKNGNGSVKFADGKGDVTISMNDDDLIKLMMGKLNPQQAFFQGKLKIKGNMAMAMKLKDLQPDATKAKL